MLQSAGLGMGLVRQHRLLAGTPVGCGICGWVCGAEGGGSSTSTEASRHCSLPVVLCIAAVNAELCVRVYEGGGGGGRGTFSVSLIIAANTAAAATARHEFTLLW
jgi:hypothetical protein